jgi:hypothetical protein
VPDLVRVHDRESVTSQDVAHRTLARSDASSNHDAATGGREVIRRPFVRSRYLGSHAPDCTLPV